MEIFVSFIWQSLIQCLIYSKHRDRPWSGKDGLDKFPTFGQLTFQLFIKDEPVFNGRCIRYFIKQTFIVYYVAGTVILNSVEGQYQFAKKKEQCDTIAQIGGLQLFWHQGPVLWKTVFPQTKGDSAVHSSSPPAVWPGS